MWLVYEQAFIAALDVNNESLLNVRGKRLIHVYLYLHFSIID